MKLHAVPEKTYPKSSHHVNFAQWRQAGREFHGGGVTFRAL
jgi:hypothetical protein